MRKGKQEKNLRGEREREKPGEEGDGGVKEDEVED